MSKNKTGLQLPTFTSINWDVLSKTLGIDNDLYDSEDIEPDVVHDCLKYVLDAVFDQHAKHCKIQKYKNGDVTYSIQRFECSLKVYLKGASLAYTVIINTVNDHDGFSCCYFSFDHMGFSLPDLLGRVAADFSNLVYQCVNIPFAFEQGEFCDQIPSGTYYDGGSCFYSRHEDIIMTPMHYYAGMIDYANDRALVPADFDSWLNELKIKQPVSNTDSGQGSIVITRHNLPRGTSA